jgi:DNA polymerase-3 subunit delta'/DNA polymerase-3 subunit gamma/tau
MNIDGFVGNSLCFYSPEIYNNKKFIEEKISKIEDFNKLDMLEIEPLKGNIKIDQIREIHDFLKYKPNYSKIKIIVIHEIDKLNSQAENSLLKILEEPPNFSLIISHTNSWNDLLPTTKSRLTRLDIPIMFKLNEDFKNVKKNNIKLFKIYSSLGNEYLDYFNNLNEKELYNFIESINNIDFEKALNFLKSYKNDAKSKIYFIYSYYYVIKRIIMEKTNETLEKTINKLKAIKTTLENPIDFLKMISLLSNIFIHDSIVSKLTNKWKYMYNYDFIEFFGIYDYKIDSELLYNTFEYNNKIINSSVSNHNFNLEIITHFIRMKETYSKY